MKSLRRHHTHLVVTAAAVAVAAAACAVPGSRAPSSDASETTSPGDTATAPAPAIATEIPDIDPDQVDVTDPDAVADAVALTIAVRDAVADASSLDSQARASRWYSPQMGAVEPGTEVERPDQYWLILQEYQAHDVVDALDRTTDYAPTDSTTAYRARAVTTHAENAEGWTGEPRTTRYWITLTQADGAWQVTDITTTTE